MASKNKLTMPEGAVRSPLPERLSPFLATLVDGPPKNADEWIFEIKFDGYRMLTRVSDDWSVRMFTRNGHDWTGKAQHLADQVASMKLKPGWLDGEIVVLGASGTTDFQALQNAFQRGRTHSIVYFFFDLPYYAGYDLRGVELTGRRQLLAQLLEHAPEGIRFSEQFDAPPQDLVSSACRLGLEGVIGKLKTSTYTSSRSANWIKLKCGHRQEFVVGGYTDPKGGRVGMGGLLLGVHNDAGELFYAGSVGSGFSDKSLAETLAQLRKIETDKTPFNTPTENDRRAHWVKPQLLAEVAFAEWTKDNHIRHPVFHGIRTDKAAKAIVREDPKHMTGPDSDETKLPAKLRVSNPERVIDPSTGITKLELVRHYALVGELAMEHLKGRPVSFVRAPQGIEKQLFFQKHLEKGSIKGIRTLDPAIHPGHEAFLEVASPEGLLSATRLRVRARQ